MKFLKNLLFVLLGLIALMVLISFFLPAKTVIDRTTVINAPAATVYEQITNLKKWEKWSPWYEMEPTATWKYSDNPTGKNAWYSWDGEVISSGKLEITDLTENKLVKTKMSFGGQGDALSDWILKEKDGATEVAWTFETDNGMNPISRWMGLMTDKFLGPQYEQGLAKMKKICESMPAKAASAIQEFEAGGVKYIGVRGLVKFEKITAFYEENFPKLGQHLAEKGMEMKGMPRGVFYKWDEKNGQTDMIAAMAISDLPDLSQPNKKIKTKGGEVAIFDKLLVCDYYGDYDNSIVAHEALEKWLKDNGKTQAYPVMEEYVTDPTTEPDPNKWLTKVYYPFTTEG